MKDKISVIVPIYNNESYLEECIESIINQTHKNLEILLIDDGSTDNCLEICKKYAEKDKRIKVFSEYHISVGHARNVGMKNATGDFIAFVDSDDYLMPNMYEKLLKKQKEKNADFTYCNYRHLFYPYDSGKTVKIRESRLKNLCEDGEIKWFIDPYVIRKNKDGSRTYTEGIFPSVWRVLFSKKILKGVEFREELLAAEDTVVLCGILTHRKVVLDYVTDCLYVYRLRKEYKPEGVYAYGGWDRDEREWCLNKMLKDFWVYD